MTSSNGHSHRKVTVERRGQIQLVTINRPEVRNAIDLETSTAISVAMDELDRDADLRVGVLTGAGGTFSSGMDLKAFLSGERPSLPDRGLGGITMRSPRKPLLAAVEGWALAGGFELALACDLVIAAEDSRFGLPEVQRSLVATGGGALQLPRRLPLAIALELLLTGNPISAERAMDLGLVNRCVAPNGALEGALDLAERLARNAPLALAAAKQIARSSQDWPSDVAWERQKEIADRVYASEDAQEGSRAFAEKRPPKWSGR